MTIDKKNPGKQDGQTQKAKDNRNKSDDSGMKQDGKRNSEKKPAADKKT